MAEEQPSLHIDSDWKKQAQEEKRRLVQEEGKRAAASPAPASAVPGAAPTSAAAAAGARGRREIPPASFSTLVQSIITQILFYLGELSASGSEGGVNLDMAKHQIDILTLLEEKTRGNLSPEEQHVLDASLYEARMRYVSVASQFM